MCMDEHVVKQKIQKAFPEPQAPEEVIRQVILRSRAIVMGNEAKKQLEAGMAENLPALVIFCKQNTGVDVWPETSLSETF